MMCILIATCLTSSTADTAAEAPATSTSHKIHVLGPKTQNNAPITNVTALIAAGISGLHGLTEKPANKSHMAPTSSRQKKKGKVDHLKQYLHGATSVSILFTCIISINTFSI